MLWEHEDGKVKDSIEDNQRDKLRWIDTSTMICECLTKFGNEQFARPLLTTMETGILDLTPTASSQLKKMRQQRARLDRILKEE